MHKFTVRMELLYRMKQIHSLVAQIQHANSFLCLSSANAELVFLNVYGASESIPRNEFRQPM